ncbi:MAG: molybdenum cofactor guanylyltransferase [Thermomicrobiales bacterium]
MGGRSRRMGQNKALIRLTPDAPPLIETVIATVGAVADEVFLVGTAVDDSASSFAGIRIVPDLVAGAGALGGIHAALGAARHDHVMVVACDMPFLQVDLLRFMAEQPRGYDALMPLVVQLQPLHAIYARSALPLIEARLSAGDYRVTSWLGEGIVHSIPPETVARFDPDLRSCFNMNTPRDFEEAMSILLAVPDRHLGRT